MTDQLDAASALAEVRAARLRSAELRGYSHAGPHLIAWGLVWLAGNVAQQFAPGIARWVWVAGIALAVVFQLTVAGKRSNARVLATVAAVIAFCVAAIQLGEVPTVYQPAFMSLAVAAAYVGLGIWTGARFAWLGLLVAAIILVARFLAPEWLPLAMGIGAGGALIMSGIWLHRA